MTDRDAARGRGTRRERTAHVIVVSTSAAAGSAVDTTGPRLVAWLRGIGFTVPDPTVVADGPDLGLAVDAALAPAPQLLITTGGTGVSPSDRTPETVEPHIDLAVPGIIEAIRARGITHTPAAALTRGVAGFSGSTFVVTLPGSTGGVRDGIAVLEPILDHALAQFADTVDASAGHAPRS